jgi:hypothetical protein
MFVAKRVDPRLETQAHSDCHLNKQELAGQQSPPKIFLAISALTGPGSQASQRD